MRLIREISNKDFGQPDTDENNLILRRAARAVILNNESKVAVLSVAGGEYHKIPGGGIEEDEDIRLALAREIYEEAGVKAEVIDEVGSILEYRDGLKQYSYCYLAKVVGEIGVPEFTDDELNSGFQAPDWLSIDEAIDNFMCDSPTFLRAEFMSLRDRTFLEEARKIMESRNI